MLVTTTIRIFVFEEKRKKKNICEVIFLSYN
jgi:hypothetical protein